MNHSIFLSGTTVDLAVITRDMADNSRWWHWFNDEHITFNTQHHYHPNTPEAQLEFFENLRKDKTKLQLAVIHKKDQVLIGMVSLNRINHQHRKCEISGIIGERKYQNLLCATEAFKLLLIQAFDQLNMHRVSGGTLIPEVVDMFVRLLGFQPEGVFRQDVFKNGRYMDIYRVGLLKEEFDSFRHKTKTEPM